MNKTPFGRGCGARLTAINDQLCFGAFAAEELNRTIIAHADPSATTTAAAFPSNSHAARIDRRLADLPTFEARATDTLCASALIAASEHVQAYFKTARATIRRLTGTLSPVTQGGDDERLQGLLIALGAPVAAEVFDTVIYLRARRNRLVHEGPLPAALQLFS